VQELDEGHRVGIVRSEADAGEALVVLVSVARVARQQEWVMDAMPPLEGESILVVLEHPREDRLAFDVLA
jgi:hypothetical protein